MNESAVRRRARPHGYRMNKYSVRSRWYDQYGSYALVNDRNVIEFHSCSLEEAAKIIDNPN